MDIQQKRDFLMSLPLMEQEQQWIDEYYKAAESLPERTPRTAQDILPIMRRNGAFRDSRSIQGTKTALAAVRHRSRRENRIPAAMGRTANRHGHQPDHRNTRLAYRRSRF